MSDLSAQTDLDEITAAIAAADLTWSAELGDPPSEPRYIQALAKGAMRALPNLASVARTDNLPDAVRLLTDIPEGTPAVLVEEAAADLVAELERFRAIVLAAERWVAHMEGSRAACVGVAAALIAAVDELHQGSE